MKILVAWTRLGPYHHARLLAASRLADIVALELDPADSTYAWDTLPSAREYARITEATFGSVRADVVAVPGWSEPGALALLERGLPVVLMSESSHLDGPRQFLREFAKRRIVSLVGAALVGGAPHREYMQSLGMDPSSVFEGYDVVDNDYFADNARRAHRNGRLPRSPFFLAVNRFIPKKNLSRLLTAFSAYRLRGGSWDLALLGDGPGRGEIEDRCSRAPLRGHVFLPGFVQYEGLPEWYGSASAFIHSSLVEQWGLVVNEALACGLPALVSNRCGCARDLVREGVNGFTFDPENVEEMVSLMERLSSGGENLASLGAAGRRIVAARGPDFFAENLVAAARHAVSRPPRRPGVLEKAVLSVMKRR